MLVFPLGLGTRLRRAPWVSLLVCAVWILVQVFDNSSDTISEGMLKAVAQTGLRDASRQLFVQYCQSRKGSSRDCERYSVLVWSGYPARTRDFTPDKLDDETADAMSKELGQAAKLHSELVGCSESRNCFAYKDIVWRFLDESEASSTSLLGLKGYQSYLAALTSYRSSVLNLCASEACLIKGNINLPSLLFAQVRHAGWKHLAGNVFAFLIFGVYVEQRMRREVYLAVLVLGGTIGMAVHASVFGDQESFTLGGSANVSAAMGLFYALFFQARMRFWVWTPCRIYFGTTFAADVKTCFPLIYLISDLVGGLDSGFRDLNVAHVAHFAHLTGFAIGALCGLAVRRLWPLPFSLRFADEPKDLMELTTQVALPDVLAKTETLLRRNPENAWAMEFALARILETPPQDRGDEAQIKRQDAFVSRNLSTICAMRVQEANPSRALQLLKLVDPAIPYLSLLYRLGQSSTLRLADAAAAAGLDQIALRLWDLFAERFPAARQRPWAEARAATLRAQLNAAVPSTPETGPATPPSLAQEAA